MPKHSLRKIFPRLSVREYLLSFVGVLSLLAAPQFVAAQANPATAPSSTTPPGAAILQDLKSFSQMASVLMIAAHPDDENTQLIAYLARGRGYRMAYLSVTRGDGGQNLLGPEFGDELGWIRTQELLAARQLDGGRQFFTRAIDFGFSKNPDETLKFWNRQETLGDVVRVIRQFRPDVVVTRFSPTQTNTHGHHTASAILGIEAFKLAGDPKAFPEQLTSLKPWQPKRILLNGGFGGAGGRGNTDAVVRIDVSGTDPVLNLSYADIAARSRAMHKSQGFGNTGGGFAGVRGAVGPRQESFQLEGGEPATNDIMDGIDTTWARVSGTDAPVGSPGKTIAALVADTISKFDVNNPATSVPALLEIRRLVAALPGDPVIDDRRAQLDRILQACLGLTIQTTLPNAEVTPGETLRLDHSVSITSSIPVKWLGVNYPAAASALPSRDLRPVIGLKPGVTSSLDRAATLPANTPVSQPYWLRKPPAPGIYTVSDPTLIDRPTNPPTFPVEFQFEIGGQTITLPDQPVQVIASAPAAQARRPIDVVAAVSLAFASEVRLFTPGTAKTVDVTVTAYRPNSAGSVSLNVPTGWAVSPSQAFSIAAVGDHASFTFNVTPPSQPANATLAATATINGQTFTTGRKEIRYDHIPVLLLQPAAEIKAVALDIAIRGKTIGYLPGAGDSVAECLQQMGYTVKQLTGTDLTADGLRGLDAVVIGVRAFNTRPDLAPQLPALFDYVNNGGTVVEQYNRPDGLRISTLGPYPLRLSSLRVTDETAKVTFLAPDHPALNTPNKITATDFDNWVQERNIYLPDQWDAHYTPLLGMADPGETPPNGSLLVAQHGKGYFVYTSLVFFRQLPAGNPGAYRLFANLVSLGK